MVFLFYICSIQNETTMELIKQAIDEALNNKAGKQFGNGAFIMIERSDLSDGARTYVMANCETTENGGTIHNMISFMQYTDGSLSMLIDQFENDEKTINLIKTAKW